MMSYHRSLCQNRKQNQRVTKLGRNANNGLNAGVTYWNLNNASGNRNHNIGSHLTLLSLLICSEVIEPCHWAKHKTRPRRC